MKFWSTIFFMGSFRQKYPTLFFFPQKSMIGIRAHSLYCRLLWQQSRAHGRLQLLLTHPLSPLIQHVSFFANGTVIDLKIKHSIFHYLVLSVQLHSTAVSRQKREVCYFVLSRFTWPTQITHFSLKRTDITCPTSVKTKSITKDYKP